jgi:hypothetical protein
MVDVPKYASYIPHAPRFSWLRTGEHLAQSRIQIVASRFKCVSFILLYTVTSVWERSCCRREKINHRKALVDEREFTLRSNLSIATPALDAHTLVNVATETKDLYDILCY